MKGNGAVVVIGAGRGERGRDGGRVARPDPSRGRILPPLGRAALLGVASGCRSQGAHLAGPRPRAGAQPRCGSPLALSFPTRRYLHVAVNGRVVEADSFAPAVAKAYADLLPKGRHPAAFLRLELGPGEVDVNVHPAKSAVRLRGGRSAYPLVVGTIRSALAAEREMGEGAAPEDGSRELTLVGQFAGRCPSGSPRLSSSCSVSSVLQSLRCGQPKSP